MDYQIDLDPKHLVILATITVPVLTEDLAENYYRAISQFASSGGPYAAIFDFSGVTSTTLSPDAVRGFGIRPYAVPGPRNRVVVARKPSVFGVARMFQLSRDFIGEKYHVVHSLQEAYDIVGVRPEDFTERLYPKELAA
jgi:hypothetical protein